MAIIFLLLLSALLLNFLGMIDLSSLPLPLSWFKPVKQEAEETQLVELLQREIANLEADRDQLLGRVDDKEGEIIALTAKLRQLEEEITGLTRQMAAQTDMASVYGSMNAAAAASILGNLPVEEALPILGKLKKEQAAAILAELDPVKASEITKAWAHTN